jgi:hypothetical protein
MASEQSEDLIEFDVPDECSEISIEAIRDLPPAERLQCQAATRALGFELASVNDSDAWWHDFDGRIWIRVRAKGGVGNGR